jgi:hypothetical protein
MTAGSKMIELVCITIDGAGRPGTALLKADTRLAHASRSEHACVTRVNDPQFVLHRP